MFSQVAGLEDRAAAQAFYQKHYMNVLQHVLSVVTDNNQIPFVGRFLVVKSLNPYRDFYTTLFFRPDKSLGDDVPSFPSS